MRILLSLLATSLIASGCAARMQPSAPMNPLSDTERTAVLRDYIKRLPAGSRVKVQTVDGQRFSATLMTVDPDHVIVQPRGRLAENSRSIPIASVRIIELENGHNSSIGKAIAVGAAAAGTAILTIYLIALATWD